MPCFSCGARQTDPVRGASPWTRGVRDETQVLVCPDCRHTHDVDLDTCASCGSAALICRLGEVECRSCGAVRLARSGAGAGRPVASCAPGLADEVEAALARVLRRVP
ncbi:hypothetical protein [Streptosporangium sp. NPDC023615]|uniref:hypothetical protein n=1 Tax=Streptosporangium sp. NPDC023615 TaxID=3154794 RepID=UPI0034277B6E